MNFKEIRERTGLTIKQVADVSGYSERTVRRWECGTSKPRKAVVEQLSIMIPESGQSSRFKFKFIDLFAGIGGLRTGFESIGGMCVFTSEWNKFSQQTYKANFPSDNHEIAGDITQIHESEIPDFDVLLAGFPCQPFSIAGVSKKKSLGIPHGFECKTQGTLFFDVARIIKYHQPAAFLLENVKNLERHDKGQTFQVIRDTLTELGYSFDWRVIDAKGTVPQHRERIFIAGFRSDVNFSMQDLFVPDKNEGPTMSSILHPENGTEQPDEPYTEGKKAKVSDKYILSDHLWSYLQNYAAKHKAKGNGFGYGLVGPMDKARTLSARYYKDGSEILIKKRNSNPRRLTPRECARLMGFDQPTGSEFKIPVSDTQAYRQFGNAVVVPVVKSVAEHMKPYIFKTMNKSGEQLEFLT